MSMGKRAISNVVATVLIVLITVAAVGILWLLLLPMMQVDFNDFEGSVRIITSEGHTYYHENLQAVSIQVEAEGEESPEYVQIIVLLEDGSEISSVHFAPQTNSKRIYAFSFSDLPRPTHAAVAPIFKYEGRMVLGHRTQFKKLPVVSNIDIYSRVILPPGINNGGDSDLDDYTNGGGSTTTSPNIWFVAPTPDNNYLTNLGTVDIATSTSGLTNEVVFLNWQSSQVGWWRMDERTGTEVADSSGLLRNGIHPGAVFSSSGRFGDAINCSLASSYIEIGPSKSFMPNENSWTIAAWFNADKIPNPDRTSGRIITLHSVTGTPWGTGISLLVGGGNEAIVRYDRKSVIDQELVAGNIVTGTWYFFGATYNGSRLTAYLNDVSSSQSFTNDFIDMSEVTPAYICSYHDTSSARFDGLVEEVMIFNRALSQKEMNSLYDATTYPYAATLESSSQGPYSYQAYAIDSSGDVYSTERRVLLKE